MSVFVLGIDPGDRHVGAAQWATGDTGISCVEIGRTGAVATIRQTLEDAIETYDRVVLVCETFQLYGDKAEAQIGSAMETSQMIGMLKYVAEQLGIEFEGQGALIKNATRKQLFARKIKLQGSIHAKDAGLHTAYFVLFNHLGLR